MCKPVVVYTLYGERKKEEGGHTYKHRKPTCYLFFIIIFHNVGSWQKSSLTSWCASFKGRCAAFAVITKMERSLFLKDV
jgi:hypothetical protein